jgi:hypothetical protein
LHFGQRLSGLAPSSRKCYRVPGRTQKAVSGRLRWNHWGPRKRSPCQKREASMDMKFHWLTGAALVTCIMAAGSPSLAQAARPWVDPPSENATSQSSVTETRPATPVAPSTPPVAAASAKEPPAVEVKRTAEPLEKPAAKPAPKKALVEKKVRRPTREASVSPRASQQRMTREDRVKRGIDSGLELMTLRTIEYPDGRRVQILTRPDPGAMSELLEVRR